MEQHQAILALKEIAQRIRTSTKDIMPVDLAADLDDIAGELQTDIVIAQYEVKRPAQTFRARINVSDSVKGVRTADSTLEMTGDIRDYDEDDFVAMRVSLTAKVDAEYPPPIG